MTVARVSATAWLVVLFVFLSAVYLAMPTAHHSFDAVVYAMDVQHAVVTGSLERLWHDYHILYEPLGYALSAIGRPAGLHPLMMMEAGNALAGALLVTLLAAWLIRRTGSPLLAASGGLALGVTGSFWYYSTDAEPYVVSTLFLFGFLVWLPLDRETPNLGRKLALSAIAFGLAADLHLSVIVVAPVAVLFLVFSDQRRLGLRRAAIFSGIAGALIAVPYLYKWFSVTRAGVSAGFVGVWDNLFAPTNPVIGQYFLASPYDPVAEYMGLLRGFAPTAAAGGSGLLRAALYVLPIGLTVAAVVGAWRAIRIRRWRELFPIACFMALLAFFSGFNLADIKFTAFLAFFLIVAAILSLADLAAALPRVRPWLWVLPVLVVVLGVANYVRFIHPWSLDENNPDLVEALLIRESTRPDDGVMLVGAGHRNGLKVYVPYFGERQAIILDFLFNARALPKEESFARVGRRMSAIEARGGTVWAIADIVEKAGDARPFLERNRLVPQDLDGVLGGRSAGAAVLRDGVPMMYPLRGAAAGAGTPR